MKKSGIYRIQNIVNNKFYIGSSVDIMSRWRVHRNKLRTNTHSNKHLQCAWNKYGESNFIFEILQICSTYLAEEQRILDWWYGTEWCYNVCSTSIGTTGYRHTDEFKEYIRRINTGRFVSKKTRKLLSLKFSGSNHYLFGKHHSLDTKKKMSISHQGEKSSTVKLQTSDVFNIRNDYGGGKRLGGKSMMELAKQYNVSKSCIKDIIVRKNWKHI